MHTIFLCTYEVDENTQLMTMSITRRRVTGGPFDYSTAPQPGDVLLASLDVGGKYNIGASVRLTGEAIKIEQQIIGELFDEMQFRDDHSDFTYEINT